MSSFELKHMSYGCIPSANISLLYSRYTKLYHELECPELTYFEAQNKFLVEVGFFSYNDFYFGGFTDSQRLVLLAEWSKSFCLKYVCSHK